MVAQLFDDDFLIDPYPAYAYLRESGRLIRTDLFGGAWLMPRFDDIMSALRNPILSADRSKVPVSQLPEEVQADYAAWDRLFGMWMLFKDPPRHTRLRKLLNHSFTPRVLGSWRPRIEEITDDLVAGIRGRTGVEYVTEFAYELPATVIAEMLGVREGDREMFVAWSAWVGIFFGTPQPSLELANNRSGRPCEHGCLLRRPHSRAPREPRPTTYSASSSGPRRKARRSPRTRSSRK